MHGCVFSSSVSLPDNLNLLTLSLSPLVRVKLTANRSRVFQFLYSSQDSKSSLIMTSVHITSYGISVFQQKEPLILPLPLLGFQLVFVLTDDETTARWK